MKQITDIISETSFGESRVGFFSGDQLIECWIEKNQSSAKITEIHLAKVIQNLEHSDNDQSKSDKHVKIRKSDKF